MPRRKSTRSKPRPTRRQTRSKSTGTRLAGKKFTASILKTYAYFRKNTWAALAVVAGLIIIALLAFPFRFMLVPAIVNGQPIFSWQYVSRLHQSAGKQVLNQLISEKLVEQEIAKQGIQISEAEVNGQVAQIESQFGAESGGLDSVLELQGLSRSDFIKQLRLNLALEKLVKSTIEISDEEVQEELSKNAEIYADLSEADAATTAAENLKSDKIQDAFQDWFQQVRSKANIQNFFTQPSINLPQLSP